ncbi:NADPH-dependent FMN reductase [sulfur-oxidizing endosymbiont of Gigantopelta aegis]|uniref:NADPH-dependent FMN reductase n=1 Tax=sulfur-oxidizing endosymbiont of Gigantopelta aegis TaxID=2794934 RepID=UPI0018DE3255|nr:NAD(P)H-dependent oxidoreductase [sulfur-oxidizing endosymbiont of Gigantopelta aegis]
MKIAIISGSHRRQSQSLKVANHIQTVLNVSGVETWLYSLEDNPLPLWDEGVWDGAQNWVDLLTPLQEQLRSCDALVVITPEWHGQVPAGLKNFFLLFGKNEFSHKPAMIVSVSSGIGGSYPVAELRMSSYKNSRLCYIPEHVIIRDVETVLNEDKSKNDERSDPYIRERLIWALNILQEYGKALKLVRDSGATETDKFGNGM